MPSIEIDESRWPLVLVTFTGTATPAEFEEYLRRLSANLERRHPTAIVLDSRGAVTLSASLRKRQAEWIDQHRHEVHRYTKGTAFIIESPLMRGALTAIFWLTRYETPYIVAATLEAGEAWAIARLEDAGISVP